MPVVHDMCCCAVPAALRTCRLWPLMLRVQLPSFVSLLTELTACFVLPLALCSLRT